MLAKPQQWWPGVNRQHSLARGLVALWPFWERAGPKVHDIVNGFDGVFTNMEPDDWSGGPVGSRLNFGGTDEYADIAGANYGFNDTDEITIAVLGKLGGNNQAFFELTDTPPAINRGALIFQEAGNLTWRIVLNGGTSTLTVALTPIYAVHVGVYGRGHLLYRNGIEVASDLTKTNAIEFTLDGGMRLGALFGGVFPLVGPIDFAAVWNRALSVEEVTNVSADPFAILRIPSIARRHVAAAGFVPYPRPRGLRAGLHALSGGLV